MRRNVGLVERGIRLLLSLSLITVVVQRATFGWLEALLSLAALFLLLNGLSGRCYLWRWLGINTANDASAACAPPPAQDDPNID